MIHCTSQKELRKSEITKKQIAHYIAVGIQIGTHNFMGVQRYLIGLWKLA